MTPLAFYVINNTALSYVIFFWFFVMGSLILEGAKAFRTHNINKMCATALMLVYVAWLLNLVSNMLGWRFRYQLLAPRLAMKFIGIAFAVAAIALAIAGIISVNRSRRNRKGKGRAILTIILAVIVMPSFIYTIGVLNEALYPKAVQPEESVQHSGYPAPDSNSTPAPTPRSLGDILAPEKSDQ